MTKKDSKRKKPEPKINETMLQKMATELLYLHNVMDSSPDIIVVTDLKRRIVNYSKSGEKNLGYSRKELSGKSVRHLFKKNNEEL